MHRRRPRRTATEPLDIGDTADLPRQLAEKRREIASRIDDLRALDARLAQLERHLGAVTPTRRPELLVLTGATPCCDAAAAITSGEGEACAVCSN